MRISYIVQERSLECLFGFVSLECGFHLKVFIVGITYSCCQRIRALLFMWSMGRTTVVSQDRGLSQTFRM
jgi:hypothetical protein